MSGMRHAVLLAFSSLLLFTAGCKSECRVLSEKQCDCTTNNSEKTACLQSVANRNVEPTAEQEELCKGLQESCDCRLLDTPSGKERCGLAVSSDAGN